MRRCGAAARPHDRIGARHPRRRRGALPPLPAAAAHHGRHPRRRPRRAGKGQRRTGPGAVRGRDRLPGRELQPHGAQPDRRRADDVRPGQLRALPAQDLQRRLGDRRAADGEVAVRHDQGHPQGAPRGHGGGLLGQRLGDRGRAHRPPLPGRRRRLPLPRRGHPHPRQGRDPQPPDRDLALPGRGHRRRRRDPRRGRDRPRLASPRPAWRLHRVQPQHPRLRPALGEALRQARAHRLRARHHDRGPDRRRRLQQRVRPSQPGRLLPHLRAGSAGRGARLPQADHDRRRPRQHPGPAVPSSPPSRRARC
jgi:hypothetical protein